MDDEHRYKHKLYYMANEVTEDAPERSRFCFVFSPFEDRGR
jgi:hypothetical protein